VERKTNAHLTTFKGKSGTEEAWAYRQGKDKEFSKKKKKKSALIIEQKKRVGTHWNRKGV